MKYWFIFIFLFSSIEFCFAQENTLKKIDSLYKEDQFYAGITYNLLDKKPKSLNQSGFSLGFQLGFIKDMPINAARNVAIGIGLGYSANSFNQDLFINKNNTNSFEYSILSDSQTYSKNKFSIHLVELPIEFRWRTSSPTEYNFWRIYTGFKFGYMIANTSKYEGDLGRIKYTNNEDFNRFQYGLTLSAGYNTWNIHLYYALNSIFSKDVKLNGEHLDISVAKIGLMFYIL
ncbi:MAG: porin family protein [Algibacter sp.]|uniref:porin family protein n=1 Tax=Algibacter sp. TaxID=1872428 RepID=UPI002616E7EF|nr:porin family protein [Algibacter sp.]MDG1731108.1 porin family protein [Algibacter sp.]MDG2177492.1 porin family protein [Algibacter sp.]